MDVSIVHKENDKYDVVGYAGDQILGGRDIDNAVLDYCTERFQTIQSICLRINNLASGLWTDLFFNL